MPLKSGFYMEKEIAEFADISKNLIEHTLTVIESNREDIFVAAQNGISLAARGSSDNACLYGKYAFEIVLGLPTHLAAPSVITLYKKRLNLSGKLVIGVSQSGESADVCAYIKAAKQSGALTVAITNSKNSSLAKSADIVFPLLCGKERAVAATKTYLAELLVFRLLVSALSGKKRYLNAIDKLPTLFADAVSIGAQSAKRLAVRYRYMSAAVVLGRGFNYSTAQEFALKLMETSYVPVHPFSFADFLHGPVALLHEGFPTFVFVAHGAAEKPVKQLLTDIKRRGGETVVFTDVPVVAKQHKRSVLVPKAAYEIDSPLLLIVPAYFFALELAKERGYNPDNPRGLSKITLTL